MITLVRASSHYISLAAGNILRNVSGATLCGWVNHATSPTGSFDRMLSIGMSDVADNSRAGLGIREDDTLYVAARTLVGDPGGVIGSAGVAPLNTLTHIAAGFDFTNVRVYFYVNGALIDNPAGDWTGGNTNNADSLAGAIGASPNGARFYFDGSIDDVRCYNRRLSTDEIKTIYNSRGSDSIYYGLQAKFMLFEKQIGFVCVGTEVIKNNVNINYNGTPVAGCTFSGSTLKYRRPHQ